MSRAAKLFLWALAVALAGATAVHLRATRCKPWHFRPFGDYWWSQGYGCGFPYDTRAKEKYLRKLTTGREEERASAARNLTDPNHQGFRPQVEPVLAALTHDPSPDVRVAAAAGLCNYLKLSKSEGHAELRVLRHVARATVTDPDPGNRYVIASHLQAVVWRFSGRRSADFCAASSEIVAQYATKGLKDEDARVASEWRAVMEQLDELSGPGPDG